jgi:hypothetical protein
MSDLLALADRIAAATEPSREMDFDVWCALHAGGWRWWSYPNTVGIDLRTISALPHYTSSLDAITAAIEQRLPGWRWRLSKYYETDDVLLIRDFHDPRWGKRLLSFWDEGIDIERRPSGQPALALCEALIRAMAKEGDDV